MASETTPAATRNGNGRKPRAHSSGAAAKKRVVGRPFKKGQSGNPAGRPKGLAIAFREKLGDDPGPLAEALLAMATDADGKPADRVAAIREYLDRGWGKAPAHAPVEGANPLGLSEVDSAITGLVDELAGRREAAAAGEAPDRALAATGTD